MYIYVYVYVCVHAQRREKERDDVKKKYVNEILNIALKYSKTIHCK